MPNNKTSPKREEELVHCLNEGMSVNEIIKTKKTSGRLLIKLKKKYGLWGA